MINWTTAPRADGATLHTCDLGEYHVEIIARPNVTTWLALKPRQRWEPEHVALALNCAATLPAAQRAALDAVMDDILGETRRLAALIESLTAPKEPTDGTQADL